MKIKNFTGIFVPVSEIFPGVQSDIKTLRQLLVDLSLTDSVFWCARLNNAISVPNEKYNHIARQQFGLSQFFGKSEIDAVNEFIQKHGHTPERITVFFRGQILELLRWVVLFCKDLPGDGTTFEDIKTRKQFGVAALLASELWAKRVFGNRFSLDGEVQEARLRAMGAIRKSIESMSSPPDLSKTLGRGCTLFLEHFSKHFPSFEDDFLEEYGISVEQYYVCLSALLTNYLNPYMEKMGPDIFDSNTIGDGTPYKKILEKFLSKESQTANEIKESLWGKTKTDEISFEDIPPYDTLPLREKPIFKTNDGRAIILDAYFFCEKATIGPLFRILKMEKHKKRGNEIFGAFGDTFEDYTCNALKRMFPDLSNQSPKRLECNYFINSKGSKDKLEADALINDVLHIILFEIKAVLIREDMILTDDYEIYLSHLRKKYSLSKLSCDRISVKGVAQIARITSEISSENSNEQSGILNRAKEIYPILLVHDPLLVAPVYGKFLADEFENILVPDTKTKNGEYVKNGMRVKPLILMTIDDLENLETSIEHFSFRKLIQDYSSECGDRLVSLHNYISTSDYNKKIYHNKYLAGKAIGILDKTKKEIFDHLPNDQ